MRCKLNKKNILFCIDSLQPGGAETILINTVNELAKDSNLKITVQLLRGKNNPPLHSSITVRKFMSDGKLYRAFIRFLSATILHALIIRGEYDLEIAYMEGASTKVISGCRKKKCRTIAWVHTDMEKYQWSQRSYRNLNEEKEAYNSFDYVFAVSSDVKRVFENEFKIDAQFVQNIINDNRIKELGEDSTSVFTDSRFHIVSVGAIKQVKGYERLVAIHRELKNSNIDCCHYILGDGPNYDSLNQKIKEAGLADRIILVGYKENPYPWIKQADLFACTSYAEGYSSVVSEAIILGTPVITTDCSGMHDILGDSEYGMIVENNDAALLDGLKELISEKDLLEDYRKKAEYRSSHFMIEKSISILRKMLEI